MTSAFDRFQSSCALALTDPDAYIASLTIPGPAGEDVVYTSDDGGYRLVHTAQAEGLTDFAEFVVLGNRAVRRCAVSVVIPDFPEAAEIATRVKPLLDSRASDVVGGLTRQVTPMWEPDDAAFVFEADPWFVFHATGLLPGTEAVTSIAIQLGSVRLAANSEASMIEVGQ